MAHQLSFFTPLLKLLFGMWVGALVMLHKYTFFVAQLWHMAEATGHNSWSCFNKVARCNAHINLRAKVRKSAPCPAHHRHSGTWSR